MWERFPPSGTGKPLSALIPSRSSPTQAAPASRAFLRSCPSKTLMRRGRCVRTGRGDCFCIVAVLPFVVFVFIRGERWAMAQSLDVYIYLGNGDSQHFLNIEHYTAHKG